MLDKLKNRFKIIFNTRMSKEKQSRIDEVVGQLVEKYGSQFDALKLHLNAAKDNYGNYVLQSFFALHFSVYLDEAKAEEVWQSCEKAFSLSKQSEIAWAPHAVIINVLLNKQLLVNPVSMERDHYHALHKDLMTDALTGLYNKRYLSQSIEREVLRAKRRSGICSVLFLDIDHFKKFNDTYGHLSGDKMLKAIADVIMQTVRSCDLPCRYGGEEFAVLLPDTPKEGAKLLGDRIRAEVKKIRLPGINTMVTISGGVSSFPQDALDSDALLNHADQALYYAKDLGRDQIALYTRLGDKRHAQRKPLKVAGSLSNHPQQRQECFTHNLSRNGALIETNQALRLGETIYLDLENDADSPPISLVAHVVHLRFNPSCDTYQLGLRIIHIDLAHQQRYRKLLEAS